MEKKKESHEGLQESILQFSSDRINVLAFFKDELISVYWRDCELHSNVMYLKKSSVQFFCSTDTSTRPVSF